MYKAVCIDNETQKATPGFINLLNRGEDTCWFFESLDKEHKVFLTPLTFPKQEAGQFNFDVPPSHFGAYTRLSCPPLPAWVSLTSKEPDWGHTKQGVHQNIMLPTMFDHKLHILDQSRFFYILDPKPIILKNTQPVIVKLVKKVLQRWLFK